MVGYRTQVSQLIACALCGADPATDSFLVHSALAAVISTPYFLRSQIATVVRRVRGGAPSAAGVDDDACPVPLKDDQPEP